MYTLAPSRECVSPRTSCPRVRVSNHRCVLCVPAQIARSSFSLSQIGTACTWPCAISGLMSLFRSPCSNLTHLPSYGYSIAAFPGSP